jgi:polar amino acid transport system substrate-binding protein
MNSDRRSFAHAALLGAAAVTTLGMSGAKAADAPNESTFDRIKRTKIIRVAALVGEAPYFNKNLVNGSWSGMCVDMANDIASVFEAKVQYNDATYGSSVLDLETGKADLAFSLSPTPRRALAIGFSRAVFDHGFGIVGRKGFEAKTWSDLNNPSVRIVVDMGSGHEEAARSFAPKAQITALKTRDDCILAVQTGRADCEVLTVILGLTAVKKNPALGTFMLIREPLVSLPNCMGVRYEDDKRWRDFLDNWADYNRGAGQIRQWMIDGLALNNVGAADIPKDVAF